MKIHWLVPENWVSNSHYRRLGITACGKGSKHKFPMSEDLDEVTCKFCLRLWLWHTGQSDEYLAPVGHD